VGTGTGGTPRVRIGAAVVVAVGVVAAAVLLVRGMVLGETLAAGDEWRIAARWSPFGSSVEYSHPRGRGGAGGLAQPGQLSETMTFPTPDDSAYVVGVVPADAATVRVTTASEVVDADVHRVLGTRFWVARVDGGEWPLVLEGLDDHGETVQSHRSPDAPPPGSPPASP
jgi:hypothetical protein